MSYEYEILRAAVRESNLPDRARGVYDVAEIRIMGAIGQAGSFLFPPRGEREKKFIEAGLCYLDNLPASIDEEIKFIQEDIEVRAQNEEGSDDLQDLVGQLIKFKSMATEVDREVFVEMLKEDFNEFYPDEE